MADGTGLDHPVVDGDGHIVEALPVVVDVIRRVAGSDVADRFGASSPTFASRDAPLLERVAASGAGAVRSSIPPWWSLPGTARDRATGFLPALLHERLDEIGIDFTVLYSSVGLVCLSQPDDAIRAGSCRGLNTYLAEMLDGLGDRMTAAAVIPTQTPDEAISAIEHAVRTLGFKAVMLNSYVHRPSVDCGAPWIDVLALDSQYDYDPLWACCVDLGVAVTVHSPTMGVGLRQSSTRYMYNHIGNFAASGEAFAKALVLGGVMHRFPTLNVAFLECGVGWGVQLLCDLVDRWHKRGAGRADRLDPHGIDRSEWNDLLVRYGGGRFTDPDVRLAMLGQSDNPPADTDDFRESGINAAEDVVAMFDRFFFGCEADDATISWAYADNVTPCGATLRPILGSDLGHWDVSNMNDVLDEAHELVEHGLLTPAQFKGFACDNTIRLHGRMNPRFFDGTRVEGYARSVLA